MASPAFPQRAPKRSPKRPAYYPRRVARPADPRNPTRYPVRQPPARVPIKIPIRPPSPPALPYSPTFNPNVFRTAGRFGARLLPGVGWALLAYEAYQYFSNRPAGYNMSGFTRGCYQPWGPDPRPPGVAVNFQTGVQCTGNVTAGRAYGTAIPAGTRNVGFGPGWYLIGNIRISIREVWTRPANMPEVPWEPEVVNPPQPLEVPIAPPWMPWYLPIFQPVPLPLAPPYRDLPKIRPNPRPRRRRNPLNRPKFETHPVPPGAVIPSYDIGDGPRAIPRPGLHERRPPEKGEKEKKTELRGSASKNWLEGMEKLISGITEMDDFVSAVYKGLPWQLRRWKGRDGVWRDRDIRTDTRLQRLYGELGSLNIKTAIKEVIKENAVDYAGAFIGKLNNKALKNNQYYRGKTGLQFGGRLTKDAWKKLKDDLALGAAKAQPDKYHYRWVMDKDGLYYRKRVLQQKQMIPWLQRIGRKTYRTKERPGNVLWWQTPVPQKDDVILAPYEWTYYVPYRKD